MNASTNNITNSDDKGFKKSKGVPIRHMDFKVNPAQMKKHCFKNQALGSAVIYAFCGTIPYGERMVIDAVREWRDEIKDPELKAQVAGLIGQEAMHSKIHEDFNEAYQTLGVPIDKINRIGEFVTTYIPRLMTKKAMLASCAGFEHFTAVMAEVSLRNPKHNLEGIDGPSQELIAWHLVEELEHKSIAYDVYQDVCGSYSTRLLTGFFNYMWMLPMLAVSTIVVMCKPGYRKEQDKVSIEQQVSKKQKPSARDFKHFWNELFAYFKPKFHPDDSDTEGLLAEWDEKLFGENGQLNTYVTKIIQPK